MNGTMIWVTLAMRCSPPKMIPAVSSAMTAPTSARKPRESCCRDVPSASTMELVWMALYTSP